MREANYWLRIIQSTQLIGSENIDTLVNESRELIAILSTIVRRTHENSTKEKIAPQRR